jgi:DNA modification methylase
LQTQDSADAEERPGAMGSPIFEQTGVIHCDDNLKVLYELPDEFVDLVYLDPPFFSNRDYEVIWGDEAEVRSFEDRWRGGIREYTDWMRKRLVEMHRVLKPTGSLYLHCDPTASHYLKVMLDNLFESPGGFRSEIIWKRSSAHSDTKQGRKQHGRIHDVILFYTKGDDWTWNPVYTPYDPEYVAAFYKHVEKDTGRRYRLGDLTGPGGAKKGNPQYEVMGVTRYWRYSREKMEQLIAEGRVVQVKPGAVPAYKRYLDEMRGVPLQDLWTDISPVSARGTEREGYPTQKPEVLLERILASSTKKGQIVLDHSAAVGRRSRLLNRCSANGSVST